MRTKTISIIAAILAASVTPLLASAASAAPSISKFAAIDEGIGPTLAAAQMDARRTIQGDYGPCDNLFFYDSGQFKDGTWWAWVSGECSALR